MQIDFYFDIVCPFAALASLRISRIAAITGLKVRYRPILLGGLLKDLGADPDPNARMPAAKASLVRLDAARQAAWMQAPLRWPERHPRRTLSAMRLLSIADPEARPALTAELFRAAWFDGRGADIESVDLLSALAARYGLRPEQIGSPEAKTKLRGETEAARHAGVFGVPTIVADGLFLFGLDRLYRLEDLLHVPRQEAAPPLDAPTSGVLEWFHDVASPFSYLSSVRIAEACRRAGVALLPRPILVGGLFREIGTPMVPIETFSAPKASWMRRDMAEIAAESGAPFRFPSCFPVRSLLPQRVACAEPSATHALYEAAWVRDLDVSDKDVLSGVLAAAGFDATALLARAEAPEVKEQLRANTDRAARVGICGVPGFLADGTERFWGQDRMHQAIHAARGWRLGQETP